MGIVDEPPFDANENPLDMAVRRVKEIVDAIEEDLYKTHGADADLAQDVSGRYILLEAYTALAQAIRMTEKEESLYKAGEGRIW